MNDATNVFEELHHSESVELTVASQRIGYLSLPHLVIRLQQLDPGQGRVAAIGNLFGFI